jgi:hypothetical protein
MMQRVTATNSSAARPLRRGFAPPSARLAPPSPGGAGVPRHFAVPRVTLHPSFNQPVGGAAALLFSAPPHARAGRLALRRAAPPASEGNGSSSSAPGGGGPGANGGGGGKGGGGGGGGGGDGGDSSSKDLRDLLIWAVALLVVIPAAWYAALSRPGPPAPAGEQATAKRPAATGVANK